MNKTIYVDVDGTICTTRSLKNINPEEFKDIQSDYEMRNPIEKELITSTPYMKKVII